MFIKYDTLQQPQPESIQSPIAMFFRDWNFGGNLISNQFEDLRGKQIGSLLPTPPNTNNLMESKLTYLTNQTQINIS